MKTIAIVATGGTIAGTGKKGKTAAYHAGEIDIDSIIETIPEINEVAHIKEYQLMNIDSNEMTHEKWLILKNNIEEILSDDTIDGAVVTHGTDTLDETAYFLTLTFAVCIFYSFNSIDSQAVMADMNKGQTEYVKVMVQMISVISIGVSVILGGLIIYATKFLINKRKYINLCLSQFYSSPISISPPFTHEAACTFSFISCGPYI